MVTAAVNFARFKNPPDAVERIAELIEREHRMVNVDLDLDGTYRVLSWTRPGVVYEVIGDACHCEGAQANLLCWHSVAAELDREERRSWLPVAAKPRALTRAPIAEMSPEDRDYHEEELSRRLFGDD